MARTVRDAILAAEDLKIETVDMRPFGWGVDVVMRELTGQQRDAYEQSLQGPDGAEKFENLRARAVAAGLFDVAGERQFETEAEIAQLGGKSAAALDHLFKVYRKLNAVGGAELEDLVKKSVPGPGGATSSG